MNTELDRQIVEIYFGAIEPERWSLAPAHAALGLNVGAKIPSDVVITALRHRLAMLDAHPMGATAQGEHARRVLNAAASAVLRAGSDVPPRLPTIGETPAPARAVPVAPASAPRNAAAPPSSAAQPVTPATASPRSVEAVRSAAVSAPAGGSAALTPMAQGGSPAGAAASGPNFAPPPVIAGVPPHLLQVIVSDLRMALGRHGGVTPDLIAELSVIVASKGVPQADVPLAVTSILGALGGGTAPTQAMPSRRPLASRAHAPSTAPRSNGETAIADNTSTDRASDVDEDASSASAAAHEPQPSKVLLVLAILAIAFAGIGVGLILVLSKTPGTSGVGVAGASDAVDVTAAPVVPDSPAGKPSTFRPPPELKLTPLKPGERLDGGEIARRLAAASQRLTDTPGDAIAAIEIAVGNAKGGWDRMSASERTAVGEAIVDVVFNSAGSPQVFDSILALLASPVSLVDMNGPHVSAEQVRPLAFSAGVFWRLARERELPAEAHAKVEAALRVMFGAERPAGAPGFNAGVVAAMRLMPVRMVVGKSQPPLTAGNARLAISTWKQALQAFSTGAGDAGSVPATSSAAEPLFADALDRLLLQGGDPAVSRPAYEAIVMLAQAMRWEAGDVSRARLGAWLNDPHVSTQQLHLITATIVNAVKVDGLDSSFILAANASPEQRSAVREAFAQAWGISQSASTGNAAELLMQAAAIALAAPQAESGDELSYAILAAQLNQAIALRTQGKADEARQMLQSIQQPSPVTLSDNSGLIGLITHDAGGEDSWASKFLTGDKALAVRLQRVKEMDDRAPSTTQLDADVLAEIAFSGSPPELSLAALRVLPKFASNPMITHAMLKALPKAPRKEAIARVIEQMTYRPVAPVTTDRWMADARRALIERLLEQVAAKTWAGRVDQGAVQLADAYQVMAGSATQPTPAPELAASILHSNAEQVYALLRAQAGALVPSSRVALTIDSIDRRREARRLVASGPIQSFAAEQISIFELLVFITAAERPDNADAAAALFSTVILERDKAEDILKQIRIVEQACARLSLARAGLSMSQLPQ